MKRVVLVVEPVEMSLVAAVCILGVFSEDDIK